MKTKHFTTEERKAMVDLMAAAGAWFAAVIYQARCLEQADHTYDDVEKELKEPSRSIIDALEGVPDA